MQSCCACVNEYRTLLSGKVLFTDPSRGTVWNKNIDTLALRNNAMELLEEYKRSNSIEAYSDYGAILIYLGEYEKAKLVYEEIEKNAPYLYTTASNLGTIYELIGKPDSALFWIKKSIEINPDSHKGSEWIHIKILEFKISNKKNIKNSILDLDFGNSAIPTNPHNYDLAELQEHVWHQLEERTFFVKPQNEIVGNIYFDLGNILAQTRDVQAALESYEAAKTYGFHSKLLEKRIRKLKRLDSKAGRYEIRDDLLRFIQDNFVFFFWTGVGFLLIFFYVFLEFKKRRRESKI